MKFVGYVCLLAALAGIAGLGAWGGRPEGRLPGPTDGVRAPGPELEPPASATSESLPGPTESPEDLTSTEAVTSQTMNEAPGANREQRSPARERGPGEREVGRGDPPPGLEEPTPRQERPSRSSRSGRPSRYPGPIPTPADWVPPEGPVRISLQVGHWRTNEAPAELSGIRGNGTRWGNTLEWEVNLEIARSAGAMLEGLGYQVDILPAVVPPGYRSHLFISIHADGSSDPATSGFRIAAPRRDPTGRAQGFVDLLRRTYREATGIPLIPTVTHRMQNYYAFNFRRYEHALHPMTIGVILETGFLTSPRDRRVIVDDVERAARGIVEAVKAFPVTPPPNPGGGQLNPS